MKNNSILDSDEEKESGRVIRSRPSWISPDFLALRDTWYEILAEEGFKDIEFTEPGVYHANGFLAKQVPADERLRKNYERNLYFETCKNFLYAGTFFSKTERYVWERHADRKTQKEIIAERKSKNLKPLSRDQVNKIIMKVRARMKTFKQESRDHHLYLSDDDLLQLEVLNEFGSAQNLVFKKTREE